MQFDYTTVGHVTVDILADGPRRPGGSAFYSALQAARLGLRAQILTRGCSAEIEVLLAPYRGELALGIEEAASTTMLHTSGAGEARRQRMLAWAGPIGRRPRGSIRRSCTSRRSRRAPTAPAGQRFLGLTAQGLLRRWAEPGGEVTLAPPAAPGAAAKGAPSPPAAARSC